MGAGLIARRRFSVVRAKLALESSPFWVSPASKQDVCYDPLKVLEKTSISFVFIYLIHSKPIWLVLKSSPLFPPYDSAVEFLRVHFISAFEILIS